MFINKLNQIYKPKRTLYYFEPEQSDLDDFYNKKIPQKISRYENAFGTYDKPGVFFLPSLDKSVIGIEYRNGDPAVSYPADLDFLELDETFFYAIEIEYENEIALDAIETIFENIAKDDDAHRQFTDLSIKKDSPLISIFSGVSGKKIRILYEWKVDRDRARDVMEDKIEKFKAEDLYHTAFFDSLLLESPRALP